MADENEINKILFSISKRIQCTLGSFYPDAHYGSFYPYKNNKKLLLCAIRQALASYDGVYALSLEEVAGVVNIHIMINNEERVVRFH